MFKKTVPALFCLLMLSSPLTALAAVGSVQSNLGETVSVITVDGVSGHDGIVGRLYYPTDIQTVRDDDEKLIIKTFEVPAGLNPHLLVEESFERSGVLYEPRDILKRTLPGTEETQYASTTVSVESKSKNMSDILKLLDPLLDHSEDGFTGQLQLDRDSITVEAVGYSSYLCVPRNTAAICIYS